MKKCACFFFKQKTAYEMRISDWSSDVCSSDLGGQRAAQAVEQLLFDGRIDILPRGFNIRRLVQARPAASEPVRLIGLIALCRLEFLFQMLGEFVGDARDEAIVNQVLRLQTCGIAFADKRMLANLRVHQRLREARLVSFVVTEAAMEPVFLSWVLSRCRREFIV